MSILARTIAANQSRSGKLCKPTRCCNPPAFSITVLTPSHGSWDSLSSYRITCFRRAVSSFWDMTASLGRNLKNHHFTSTPILACGALYVLENRPHPCALSQERLIPHHALHLTIIAPGPVSSAHSNPSTSQATGIATCRNRTLQTHPEPSEPKPPRPAEHHAAAGQEQRAFQLLSQ